MLCVDWCCCLLFLFAVVCGFVLSFVVCCWLSFVADCRRRLVLLFVCRALAFVDVACNCCVLLLRFVVLVCVVCTIMFVCLKCVVGWCC